MKLLLLIPWLCCAAEVRLVWDPNPTSNGVLEYRVYELQGTNYTLLTNAISTNVVLQVTLGPHVYSVSAWNGRESNLSSNLSLSVVQVILNLEKNSIDRKSVV